MCGNLLEIPFNPLEVPHAPVPIRLNSVYSEWIALSNLNFASRALLRFPNRIRMRIRRGLKPPTERQFLLRVKLDAFDALNVQVAEERFVPAGEREPRHGGGNADVDADHAGVETAF